MLSGEGSYLHDQVLALPAGYIISTMPMTSLVYEASPYSVHERLLILPMIWRTAQTAHGQCGVGELTTKTDVEGHVRIVRMKIQTLKAHNIKMHSSTKHLTESIHDPTAGGMLLGAE